MPRTIAVLLISGLIILGFGFYRACADDAGAQGLLARDFSQQAMDKFQSINDTELNYAGINDQVDAYAQKFAKNLLKAGVDQKTAGMIMQKSAAWYGQALVDLFNGKPYNQIIQDYSSKIADLFSRQHLGLDTQSAIVDMTSDNLESLDTLFRGLEE
ncbi:MAG: hypothetical protein WC576_03695 [Candidatus Omnitrophota bacterium]|jgi:hypothetical protein